MKAVSNSNAAVSTAAHSLAALATDRQMSSESAGSANEAAAAAAAGGQHPLAQTHRPLALQRSVSRASDRSAYSRAGTLSESSSRADVWVPTQE